MTEDEATAEIIKLEGSYPPYDPNKGRYDDTNKAWELHHVKVRDAYWRRRMIIAERDGDDLTVTAAVY